MTKSATQSSSTILTIDDLSDLLEMLSSVKHKCVYIGLKLGVSYPTIESITKQHATHLDQLREILQHRLKQVPHLTQHDIFQALRSTTVEESVMASEIQSQNMLASASPKVRTEPLVLSFSTATLGPPTCALTSEAASSRPEIEPVTCSMSNLQQAAYLPAQTPCQISSQPLATPTNRMYQHYTGQWPPHRHSMLPPYVPQYPVLYPGAWWGMHTPYMCPVPPQQPYYHHPNPYSSALLQPSAEQCTVSTTQSTIAVNISTDNQMQPDTSHQPFRQDQPHFSSCTSTVQQVGQAPPTPHHGMTTHSHLHQVNPQQVSQCQSQEQEISDHDSKMESNDTSRAASSADQYTVSTIPPTTPMNISRGYQMQHDRSHQPTSQEQPHFPSSSGTVQQDGQAPPNPHHGMTTHDHLHQVNPQQVSQCQSQQQDISDHVSQMESNGTSRAAFDCDTPPAKRVHLETPMDQFISYIKQTYRLSVVEKSLNVIKWPPTPSKIFINLVCIDWRTVVTRKEADEFTRAMVEDGNVDVIMKKKTPIEFSDIVQDLPDTALEKVILVEGAPGVGKSTFAWELCRRWERGEIAQQYRLVLLLRLRDDRISKAQNLRDLLYHPKDSVCDAVEENLIHTFGDKCLIILEGFDELADTCRTESSLFLKLINGQLLPLATIVVTSRPWAASALLDMCHHNIFKHIEILGFTETQIEEYVRSAFTDEKNPANDPLQEKDIEDTLTYIATYPQIKACMYIPLNSAIVVSVYQESKAGRCILPKTLTELYYALTQTLLLRYLRGHPVHKKIRNIKSFERDLPQEVYEQLLEISEIAYNGICTDWGDSVQLIYSDLPPTFETLGLMQSVSQMYITQGVTVSHNFLHLTVQEFLAALHISKMSPEEQLKHFKRHKEGRFRVVLRFLAGLTKLVNISLEHRRALLEKPRSYPTPRQRLASMMNPHHVSAQDTSYTQMKSDISVSVHPLNWLFETQSSDVIKAWLQDKTVEFKFPRQMSPLEYYSAGYCIANSSAQWVLTIQEHKEETDLKMFCDGITSTKADFKIGLKVLVHMATEKIETLLTNLDRHIQELHLKLRDSSIVLENLSALQVLHLELNCKKTFDLTPSLLPQSLEALTIIEAGSGSSDLGLKSCAAIRKLTSSLKYLKFRSGKKELHGLIRKQTLIDSKCMESITKAMANNTSLQLMSLEVDCACTFTASAAEWLTTFITNSKQLQNLHIGFHCILEQEGTESLVKALANNESLPLKRLTLPTLEISDTAADSLALFIQKCATLEFVNRADVTWNINETTLITACGLREMANAEHHYSWLPPAATGEDHHCVVNCIEDGIDFDHIWQHHSFHGAFTCHNIGDEGACSFGASLIKNSTVRRLYFNSNHAHPGLTKVLHHGRHHLTNEKISDAGVTALAQALHHNSTLLQLDLSNNSVSDAGTTAVAQALHHNSTLLQLDLSNNSVSDAGVTAVAQALHHNSTLLQLDLSNNSVSDAGTTAVAQALHHNSTLQKLDLSNNSVSDAGTTAVAQALHHNSTLRELDLSNNSITDAGATAIAQALHHSSTLHKLDLSNNSIGDAGATALAQGLHVSRLGGLNMSGNDAIHKEGTCELVHALTVTTYPESWWTLWGGLVLPKRCEEFATQCPEYVKVKTRVKFV